MSYSSTNNYFTTSEAGFNSQMSDVLLVGSIIPDFSFEDLTSSNLINDFSKDFVSRDSNSSINSPTISSFNEPLLLSNTITSETITDTQTDVLEVQDAPNDYGVLSVFDQFNVGNLATNTTESLGGLYDDPIEYGTPLEDAYYWRQQQGQNSCAVVAQICVYQSLTGQYVSEDAANNYAQQQGWFDPQSGTAPQYVGYILNALGISAYQQYGASINSLASTLANGDKPIVALDGNEIWNPQRDWYGNPIEQAIAGHAVWVTGIDLESDGSVNIILNDSGTPYGQASVVDYNDFMNAWQDYNNFLVVADNPFV